MNDDHIPARAENGAATTPPTVPALTPDAPELQALDKAAARAAMIESKRGGETVSAALAKANALVVLRNLLSDEILDRAIMPLVGTRIGFLTDRDHDTRRGPYPRGIIRDCLIEALMMGVPAIGNRFNVIGGRLYLTREGVTYKLDHLAGLHYAINVDLPFVRREPVRGVNGAPGTPGEATVGASIRWHFGDAPDTEETVVFAVRVNAGMGAEAIQGKAWTRAAKLLWERASGRAVAVTDGETVEAAAIAARPNAGAIAAPRPTEAERLAAALAD